MDNNLLPLDIVKSSGLEQNTANYIQEKFAPFFEQVKQWKDKAQTLVVTDISQKEEMKLAKESRLAIRSIRINADKVRKELKEDSLRYGKAVQGVYNVIEDNLKPIEQYLEEQEKFEERYNEKIKAELRAKREEMARPYSEFMPSGFDLTIIDENSFMRMLDSAKIQFQKRNEELRLEEEERLRLEEANRKEMEELKKALQEKAKLEAELIERERKEKEEKERLQAIIDAEEKKKALELKKKKAEERRLKNAPDKEILLGIAKNINTLHFSFPELKGEEAKQILLQVENQLNKISVFIAEQSELLTK